MKVTQGDYFKRARNSSRSAASGAVRFCRRPSGITEVRVVLRFAIWAVGIFSVRPPAWRSAMKVVSRAVMKPDLVPPSLRWTGASSQAATTTAEGATICSRRPARSHFVPTCARSGPKLMPMSPRRWHATQTVAKTARPRVALPEVEIVTMPGLGHYPCDEKPEDFLAIVDEFLG